MASKTTPEEMLQVTYLNECLNIGFNKTRYPNGYIVCKLAIKSARYWFIYNNQEWKCAADFQSAPKLKKIIIRELSKKFAPMSLVTDDI